MKLDEDFYRSLLDNISDGVYCVDTQRKIFYWNRGAERITGFTRGEVIGSCCADNILKHVNETGRELCHDLCPLVLSIEKKESTEAEVYLHHKEGHRTPVVITVDPMLNDSGEVIGAVEVFRQSGILSAIRDKLREYEGLAMVDDLTRLATRRFVEMNLGTRIAEAKRYLRGYGILYVDLDNFKQVNDRMGHDTGDKILVMAAATLHDNIRLFDVAGRWGGDEFVVVVEVGSEQDLRNLAEKLRALIEKSFLERGGRVIRVTASVGATLLGPDDTVESAIQRADKLMYRSKQAGKNSVTLG